MRLTPDKSLCKSRQKIIVSRDKGTPREHRAENPKMYYVRHYQLDGGLISQQKCCDFLLYERPLAHRAFETNTQIRGSVVISQHTKEQRRENSYGKTNKRNSDTFRQ